MTKKRTTQHYEIVYYDGSNLPPAYYLIDEAEGESPKQVLRRNLKRLIAEARDSLGLSPEYFPDEDIQGSLCAIRSDGLVFAGNVEPGK